MKIIGHRSPSTGRIGVPLKQLHATYDWEAMAEFARLFDDKE